MRPSAIFHALEPGGRASCLVHTAVLRPPAPSSAKTSASSIVSQLPRFPPLASLCLRRRSHSHSCPRRPRVHPTFRVDPDFRVVVPTAASFIARSRSGAFHGRSACPESLPDQKERATRTSKQITEDCSSFVFIFALKLVSSD